MVPGHQRIPLPDLIPVSYHLFSERHVLILFQLDRPTAHLGSDLHFLFFWFIIPILCQELEEITYGSGTPKNSSVRLDPGDLSSFQ
jgi:hypothetical protein